MPPSIGCLRHMAGCSKLVMSPKTDQDAQLMAHGLGRVVTWGHSWILLGPPLMAFLLVWLAFRITQGVDLSDESYYAIFLDNWLKEGIHASPFLSLHQTAALLVYPPTLLFRQLTGSTDGLILFLRVLYVMTSLAAASCVVAMFRRLGEKWIAWLAGSLVLAFIPFGLPAPSYNTLGELATIAGLAGYGCGLLDYHARRRTCARWLVGSALAWSIAIVAYPPLILAVAVLLICVVTTIRGSRRLLLCYVGLVLGFQLAAWSYVIAGLTWARIRDSISYQSSIAASFDFTNKISLITGAFLENHAFTIAAAVAILVGLSRTLLNSAIASIATGALLLAILFFPSALFLHSHDAVLLAALTGLGLLGFVWQNEAPRLQIIAVIYITSLSAGTITAATATHGLFAFPIGGLLAAIVAVLIPPGLYGESRWAIVSGGALLGLFISSSASFYYGENSYENTTMRKRITQGAFAGLAASTDAARLIEVAQSSLQQWTSRDATFVAVGRLPGLYLLTGAHPKVLTPFPLTALAGPSGLAATFAYYVNSANRPAIVAIYTDAYFQPINPIGPRFDEWYELVQRDQTPLGVLDIYRRR